MRYWLREVAGWFVVVLGLFVFYLCYDLLRHRQIVETGTLSVIGIFLFRGGIHLLKMAVAAQVCLEAQAKADAARRPAPAGARSTRLSLQPGPTRWLP
jgi:hypothetical protein